MSRSRLLVSCFGWEASTMDPEPNPREERRLLLQEILDGLAGPGNEAYFQPPNNLVMTYPCIRYKRDDAATRYADNLQYLFRQGYQVTVIDRDPDSIIVHRVAQLPLCQHDRTYTANDLNHDVFTLFF